MLICTTRSDGVRPNAAIWVRRRWAPDEKLRSIDQVRLADQPVPISEANHLRYGVSTTPTLLLLSRRGIVRLYHPGQMAEQELEAAIRRVL